MSETWQLNAIGPVRCPHCGASSAEATDLSTLNDSVTMPCGHLVSLADWLAANAHRVA